MGFLAVLTFFLLAVAVPFSLLLVLDIASFFDRFPHHLLQCRAPDLSRFLVVSTVVMFVVVVEFFVVVVVFAAVVAGFFVVVVFAVVVVKYLVADISGMCLLLTFVVESI